jgi:hypothetical protein
METLKYNLTYNDSAKDLLDFLIKTQHGLYSKDKPILTDIRYRRIEVQENSEAILDVNQEENLLFGITY